MAVSTGSPLHTSFQPCSRGLCIHLDGVRGLPLVVVHIIVPFAARPKMSPNVYGAHSNHIICAIHIFRG